jgi:DMSO/TMAO reductase YedYZ molybdopterin-dependent catalytic subunit
MPHDAPHPAPPPTGHQAAGAPTAGDPTAGLVVVNTRPPNAESPAEALAHAVTPSEAVYLRTNFGLPAALPARLEVGGAVARPLALGWDELRAMPQRTVTATMECAGNDRVAVRPLPEGEPWLGGAVSTVAWTGVPLADLLARAGLDAAAVEVLATGADAGPRADADAPGPVTFARSLPRDEALAGDALVALAMNGEPLPAAHGAPARLVVPGWYGMASVKWLARLDALAAPFAGYFQRRRYVYDDGAAVRPVGRMRVKSAIVSPADGARVARGTVRVWGWAWSGGGAIAAVDVAHAGGAAAWAAARLEPGASPHAWTRWEAEVRLDAPGRYVLRSRARDAAGAEQPEVPPWNRLGYGNNAVRAVVVDVV